jgi:hypothetical protein
MLFEKPSSHWHSVVAYEFPHAKIFVFPDRDPNERYSRIIVLTTLEYTLRYRETLHELVQHSVEQDPDAFVIFTDSEIKKSGGIVTDGSDCLRKSRHNDVDSDVEIDSDGEIDSDVGDCYCALNHRYFNDCISYMHKKVTEKHPDICYCAISFSFKSSKEVVYNIAGQLAFYLKTHPLASVGPFYPVGYFRHARIFAYDNGFGTRDIVISMRFDYALDHIEELQKIACASLYRYCARAIMQVKHVDVFSHDAVIARVTKCKLALRRHERYGFCMASGIQSNDIIEETNRTNGIPQYCELYLSVGYLWIISPEPSDYVRMNNGKANLELDLCEYLRQHYYLPIDFVCRMY